MNEKYKFGNSYHLSKIREAITLNYKTFIGLLLSCIILCYENIYYGILLYIFCTNLCYLVHVLAHTESSKGLNRIHEYHHKHNPDKDLYAHYTQIFLELTTGISPIILIYLFTGRVFIKYDFEPYVIFMFSYFYSSIHNINYSVRHVNKIHYKHHGNWSINYGPDILDVLYGTKGNYEELENTEHYLPNLAICTLLIKGIQIVLEKVDENKKNTFLIYLIRTYGFIMSLLFMFNLKLLVTHDQEIELKPFIKKIEKVKNKINEIRKLNNSYLNFN